MIMNELKLIVDGKRLDGRRPEDMRPIVARAGILKKAEGSGYFSFGSTSAIAGVYGPNPVYPRFKEEQEKAILRVIYSMAPFSTTTRVRPGISRRGTEISLVIKKAFESVLFLEEFPKTMIEIYVEILEANASTRCAAINAVSLALADAGIPMRDLIASCSVGKIDGQIAIDIAGKEDEKGEVDIPVAYYPRKDFVTLLQMDGIMSKEDFKKAVGMAIDGCKKIHAEQKNALRSKYTEMDLNDVTAGL